MAPLRCLTYGLITSRNLANQKRVRQARDQRSVTQRMRPKLVGIFVLLRCFFKSYGPIPLWLLFFFTWRLANPNNNKILPQVVFWCFFQGCSSPKAVEQVKRENDRGRVSRPSFNLFSLKTLKNGVLRTILFRASNIKISILIFHGC